MKLDQCSMLRKAPTIWVTGASPPLPLPGNTKGGSITVLLTSCLTGLD